MINMGKTMLMARQYLYFGLFLNIPIVASQTTVNGYVGQEVKIPCRVGGTYTLPQWRKGVTPLTSQDVARLNPAYPRFSYDTDNKTLVVSPAQVEDSGTYECTHTVGTNSPQNTIVVITEAPATITSPTTSSTTTSSTTTSSTTTSTASTATTSPQAPPANPPSTPRSAEEKGFTKTIMIIVIVCSCGTAAIVVFIVLLVIRHWNHQNEKKSPNEMVEFQG